MKIADQYRRNKKNGRELPNLVEMLSKPSIDYDRVEALLMVQPQMIHDIKCSYKDGGLLYEVPANMDRDIQACNLQAVSIVCWALTPGDFNRAITHLSRRKQHYIKGAWMRFQNAKRQAMATA